MKRMYRMIAPEWLRKLGKDNVRDVYSLDDVHRLNKEGYNAYYFPNSLDSECWSFNVVFVDFDCKSRTHESKDAFIDYVANSIEIVPNSIVDSGNGIHMYWNVTGLDKLKYLELMHALANRLRTDQAICKATQLMRVPGTLNTKVKPFKKVEVLYQADGETDYLTFKSAITAMPPRFMELLKTNDEIKSIWSEPSGDRSADDYRLAHLLHRAGLSKDEAVLILSQTPKAKDKGRHAESYVLNAINKIWTGAEVQLDMQLSRSVSELLAKPIGDNKGLRIECSPIIDNTVRGYRLGDVFGLVAGSGVGKTAITLNMFMWFATLNPEYNHMFVSLEQPATEIAERWNYMTQGNEILASKVHVLDNYNDDGSFRHLSLADIQTYVTRLQAQGTKLGCIVIDHIGALKKKGKNGENQDLIDICHAMKAFAIQTNTFLIMQSQASRAKAGQGDIPLDKDAAYGTMYFESYCDYLLTLWQPLNRCHMMPGCPTVTAFKFCKIRHKKPGDIIKENKNYFMYFDTQIEKLRPLTDTEIVQFNNYLPEAVKLRNADKGSAIIAYHKAHNE